MQSKVFLIEYDEFIFLSPITFYYCSNCGGGLLFTKNDVKGIVLGRENGRIQSAQIVKYLIVTLDF